MSRQEFTQQLTRYAVAVPLQYRPGGTTTGRSGVGWTKDLSTRGAWVELPEAFARTTDIEVRFRPLSALAWIAAHVVWVRLEPVRRELHLHGLAFVRLTSAQRQALLHFLTGQVARDTVRRYCTLDITCERREGTRTVLVGQTRDLSKSGVAVRLPEPVSVGTMLRVAFQTPFGAVGATTQVVWSEPIGHRPADAPYRHGLKFVRFEEAGGLPLNLLLAGLK